MAVNGNGRGKIGQTHRQLTLRDQVSLDPTDLLKASMQEAIKNSGLSRAQVVDEMNRMSGIANISVRVTEAMLDKWVARGARGHLISVRELPIFCRVVGSLEPLMALLPPGVEVVSGEDLARLQWARAEVERRKIAAKARKLAREAGIE